MKNLLSLGIVLPLFVFTVFYQCCSTAHVSSVPDAVTSFVSSLHQDAQPVKSEVDQENEVVYWLSFVGSLHSIKPDGSQHLRLNQGSEAWKDVTFIEDFCLNEADQKLYFTDLLDLKTGQSAIKATDTEGKNIEVVTYLTHEIPYQISLSEDKKKLFFLSKTDIKGSPYFHLRFVDLKERNKGILYSSVSKINSLDYDNATKKVMIRNTRQQKFAFSTDLETMKGLAEAFQPL